MPQYRCWFKAGKSSVVTSAQDWRKAKQKVEKAYREKVKKVERV